MLMVFRRRRCYVYRNAGGDDATLAVAHRQQTGKSHILRINFRFASASFLRHADYTVAGGRHFLENTLPDAALGPTIVAVVDGRRRPIGWRNIAPAASCFQYMQDA